MKYFGTDGIRGVANAELTPDLAYRTGLAMATALLGNTEDRCKVFIGRDTRISGNMLECALAAGICAAGVDVYFLGVLPTPAIAYLTVKHNAQAGVVISASHNPSEYNGIKLFNNEGFKLPDAVENEIEKYLLGKAVPTTTKVGTYELCDTAVEDYVNYLVDTSDGINTKLKVVVDCANGSASATAPMLFEKLGMDVTLINFEYDGYNINDKAGSTHLDGLVKQVKKLKADVGIAYDGDADRCLMIDEDGNEVDGDQIMAISTYYLKKDNKLTNNTLVGTVMSNLGLVKFCEANDINFVATKVGDRYVLEKMLECNYIVGGEQSGHVIYKEHANTGDGELTSIQILNILSKEEKKFSEIASIMKKYPQVLINVKVTEDAKGLYDNDEQVTKAIKSVEKALAGEGRVLIRASGTEALIRVMIEGLDQDDINKKAKKIADVIEKKFGA